MAGEPISKVVSDRTSHSDLSTFSFPLSTAQSPGHVEKTMHPSPADGASPVSRFAHYSRQTKALVKTHGVYTTYAGTTVFCRAPIAPTPNQKVSTKKLALSLAAAQDCAGTAQIEGPAQEDLCVFKEMWAATKTVLDNILETGNLDHETFGWGIYGLSTGYMPRASWQENSKFTSLQTRLHDGLLQMLDMDQRRKRPTTPTSSGGQVEVLAKANRQIHVCANLLLQQFRREEWKKIRWYHGMAVAERWIEHLGLEGELVVEENC